MEVEKIVILVLAFLILGIAYIGFMVRSLIIRNQLYKKLINSCKEENVEHDWYKVRFSSEGNFAKWLKLVPWDGNGLLVIKRNNISLYCSLQNEVNITFDKKITVINWIGKKDWRNGVFSWFQIKKDNKCMYFTSETGFSGVNSEKSTKEIFKRIKLSCDR